jgi:tripartite-type tricarboxylate transporter receptor subunit TctC
MITRRSLTLALAALPFGMTKTGAAQPRSYPTKPIRFVVPFPPGGSTDVGARLIAENLSRAFAQQVYVENKSGANGTIGVEDAAKSAPDGYTILFTIDTVASNPHVFHSTIDPSRDLLPIIQVSRQPIVLAAHPRLALTRSPN